MTTYLKNKFALSDKGAKDLVKSHMVMHIFIY